MSEEGNLAARRWTGSMLAITAAILAAAAYLTISNAPHATIPVRVSRWATGGRDSLELWALYIAPGALILLALIAYGIRGWLPHKIKRRHALVYLLFGLMLIAVVLQYCLIRDLFASPPL